MDLPLLNFESVMKFKYCIILIYLLSAEVFSQIEDGYELLENKDELVLKLDSLSKNLNSLKSNFTQLKHISVLDEEIKSKGRLLFLKPSNVKWSYYDPFAYEIAIMDSNFSINNDGKISKSNAESRRLFKEINNIIVGMVDGSILKNQLFESTIYQNNSFYLAELTPTNSDFKRFISKIYIHFEKTNVMVSTIKLIESSDDFTHIEFNNQEINPAISKPDFQFKN